jgi:hypothetical protein
MRLGRFFGDTNLVWGRSPAGNQTRQKKSGMARQKAVQLTEKLRGLRLTNAAELVARGLPMGLWAQFPP